MMRPTTLTQGPGLKVPTKRDTRRIPPSEWEALKSEIDKLYRDKRRKLHELVDYLNTEKRFRVK